MTTQERVRWDRTYQERRVRSPGPPADWLVRHLGQIPRGGRALDLAAGDGCNALLLASRGWKVTAVDISPAGMDIGRRVAGPLPIEWVVADLDTFDPPPNQFDLVLCFKFLDRGRLRLLIDRALKPDGLFIGETFNLREADQPEARIRNPAYLLGDDEWLRILNGYQVLDHDQGGTTSGIFARRTATCRPA